MPRLIMYGIYFPKLVAGPSGTLSKSVFYRPDNFYSLYKEDSMKTDFGPFSYQKLML